MDTKKQEALKELVLEMGFMTKQDVQVEVDKQTEEIEKAKEENTDLKAKIEAFENRPAKEVNVTVPGQEKTVEVMYKKRYLPNMSKSLISLKPERREAVAKMFIDFCGDYLKHNKAKLNIVEKTDLTEGTAATVGNMVFPEYIAELMAFAREKSVALQECRIIDVSTNNVYIPTEKASVAVVWEGETNALAATNPEVAQLQLTPAKLAAYVVASNELLDDSAFDITSWLTELFAESIAQELDSQIWSGADSATSPFIGIIDAAGTTKVSTDTTAVTSIDIDYLAEVISNLPSTKSAGAKFYFHRSNFRYVRTLEDSGGKSVYTPAMGGAPGAIWEYPYTLSEQMSSTHAPSDCIGVFGNLKNYIIARRSGSIVLEADPYGLFTTDMVRFRVKVRYDGKPWNAVANSNGFVQMNLKA